jgi:hypothetical protein
LLVGVLALAALAALAAVSAGYATPSSVARPAAAQYTPQCTGYMSGSVDGNLVVPEGADCTLDYATVTGSLTVQSGATVDLSGSTIFGSIACNKCGSANADYSTVGGNFTINGEKQGSYIDGNVVHGNLQILNSGAGDNGFQITSNNVGGNVTFNNNTGYSSIGSNTIIRTLQCQENVPPPDSYDNKAMREQGQCEA